MICPCSDTNMPTTYQMCCQPYHEGKPTHTAEALMRSRYSAFVLKDIEYIIKTTVPAQAVLLDRQALQAWAEQMDWQSLSIKSHTPKIGKRHAQVHFLAYYRQDDGVLGCHDERSAFVQVADETGVLRWYFLDPTVPIAMSNKEPCLCGSGDKFKACCGKFLY